LHGLNYLCRQKICYTMIHLQESLDKLSNFKKKEGQRFGIKRMGVFGSVARQQNTENSDIDIVVEMDNPSMTTMYELNEALKAIYSCDVDLLRYRPTLRSRLRSNIKKEAIYV